MTAFGGRALRSPLTAALAAGVLSCAPPAALAATNESPAFTPANYAKAGATVTVAISGNADFANSEADVVLVSTGSTFETNPQCASNLASEQAVAGVQTVLHDSGFGPGAYSYSAPWTSQAGDWVFCGYIGPAGNASADLEGFAYPYEVDALPSPPPFTQFHVVDQRGNPQFAFLIDANGEVAGHTDPSGNIVGTGQPGQVLHFTRDPSPPPICQPPEGAAGAAYTWQPGVASTTIVLPNTTGDPYQPGLTPAKRWIVGKINAYRQAHGVGPVTISTALENAADAVARDSALRKQSAGSYPFPPPFCDAIAQDFNWPSMTVASEDAGVTDPAAALAHWTDSSARGQQTASSLWTAVGVGNGDGAWIIYFGTCPSGEQTRCGMTGDQGDPTLSIAGQSSSPSAAAPGTAAALAAALGFPRTAKAGKNGAVVIGHASCPNVCGKLTVSARGARHVLLGAGVVKVRKGQTRAVGFRLTRKSRQVLARTGTLKATVTVRFRNASGRALTVARLLTIT